MDNDGWFLDFNITITWDGFVCWVWVLTWVDGVWCVCDFMYFRNTNYAEYIHSFTTEYRVWLEGSRSR